MLLKQLYDLKLAQMNESAGEYVLALVNSRTNAVLGYYVADDEDVTADLKTAAKYSSKPKAESDAKICNNTWDLPKDERFIVKLAQMNEADENLKERYESSADFDADMAAIQSKLNEAKEIMQSANWIQHMRDTESNFDVDGLGMAQDHLFSLIEEAVDAADEFYELMLKAV